jgi:hypothetical protein
VALLAGHAGLAGHRWSGPGGGNREPANCQLVLGTISRKTSDLTHKFNGKNPNSTAKTQIQRPKTKFNGQNPFPHKEK